MFQKASILKLRFATTQGNVTTEDLWDMPLTSRKAGTSLDDLAKSLNKLVKDSGEESFVVKRSTTNTVLALKFEIVKHVIDIKLAEKEKAELAVERKARREKLLRIKAAKEDASLEEMSMEDVDKMLEELRIKELETEG